MAGVYALTPDLADLRELSERVAAALAGGVRIVQYRNKGALNPSERLDQARVLRRLCTANSALLIVNDDVDLAAEVRADGVHLGRDDASVTDARSRLGPRTIIGASCYDSLTRAEAAVAAGADYVAFGSFYPSLVKPNAVRASPSLIVDAKSRWSVPVVVIGGITAANALPLLKAGADAIAVVTALFDAPDIAAASRELVALFGTGTSDPASSADGATRTLRAT